MRFLCPSAPSPTDPLSLLPRSPSQTVSLKSQRKTHYIIRAPRGPRVDAAVSQLTDGLALRNKEAEQNAQLRSRSEALGRRRVTSHKTERRPN